jgi:hypothetical protein
LSLIFIMIGLVQTMMLKSKTYSESFVHMVKENYHLVFFCLVAYILSASDFFYVNSLGAEQ